MSASKVVVTGVGLATPLGGSLAAFNAALFGGGARFEAIVAPHCDALPGARATEDPTLGLARSDARLSDRHAQLALLAATRALHVAGLQAEPDLRARAGVYVGCGSGPVEANHRAYEEMFLCGGMHGLALLRCLPSGAGALVALRHGLRGPNQTQSAACASSTLAIGEALRAIRHGYLDLAVVGGAEAPFAGGNLHAWQRLRVLAPLDGDPGRACRPFDRQRRGLVLGEGAAFFVLESERHAAARQAPVLAVLEGFGASCDAHHWTEPSPAGQVQAMQAALDDARLEPADVQAINAHGTGTLAGDDAEAESIAQVFGPAAQAPWVHATKSLHGHLLGASGAIELAAVIACLQAGRVPCTRNLENPGTNPLRLVMHDSVRLPEASVWLSNSFAFGGSNACLVISGARAAA